jgi:hypothetical protein
MVRRDLQAIARLMPVGKSPAEIARETGTDERRLVQAWCSSPLFRVLAEADQRNGSSAKAAEAETMKTGRAVRKKAAALILSGIFPGLGQLYNRELLKATLFVTPSVGLSWLVTRAVSVDPLGFIERGPSPAVILAVLVLLAIWLWSVVDAWRSAGG